MGKRHRGHYTRNKYDLLRATRRYNNRAQLHQEKITEPIAHHILVIATNIQGKHQSNVSIDPTPGASL